MMIYMIKAIIRTALNLLVFVNIEFYIRQHYLERFGKKLKTQCVRAGMKCLLQYRDLSLSKKKSA